MSDHYKDFSRYVKKPRWMSYWHQVNEVLAARPDSVLLIGVGNGIIPFPFIEEMGNRGVMAGALFFKIIGFPMISKRKNNISMAMICFMTVCGRNRQKLNFLSSCKAALNGIYCFI